MATFEEMIQEVLMNLEGFVGDQDIYGTLHASLTNNATSFVVDGAVFADGSGFSTGIIEVGEELIYTQSLDRTTGTFSGCLRGWRGTTATTHAANELVRNNPRFPRIAIKRAINDAIKALHPRVPVLKTVELTTLGGRTTYDIPADALNVVAVSVQSVGPSQSWTRAKHWTFDATGGNNSTTKKTLDVRDTVPGRKVQVVYQAEPAELVNAADDFAATTGLFDWLRSLVILGACVRLSSYADGGRAMVTSAEQQLLNGRGTAGTYTVGQNLSKYFFGLYDQQLREAEARIQDMYPAAKHFIR